MNFQDWRQIASKTPELDNEFEKELFLAWILARSSKLFLVADYIRSQLVLDFGIDPTKILARYRGALK